MTFSMARGRFVALSTALVVTIILLTVVIPGGRSGRAADDAWVSIQVHAQGLSLRAPPDARAIYFTEENILQVVPAGSPHALSVQSFPNPKGLTAGEWAQATFLDAAQRGISTLVPVVPVIQREQTSVAGLPAETMVVVSPAKLYRRTVVAQGGRVFLFGHPVGDGAPEALFGQIMAGALLGLVTADQGVQAVAVETSSDIPNLPVPYYSQRDPRWVCDQIGSCRCYMGACSAYTGIGDAGCYITAEAMIFEYYTGGFLDPQQMDACLTQNGGYTYWAGCGYGLCAVSYNPLPACKPQSVSYASFSSSLSVLDQDLRDGYPVIAWVDWGSHYLVIIGKKNGLYQVLDPLYARTQIYPGQIIHFVRLHGTPAPPGSGFDPQLQPGFPVPAFNPGSPLPSGALHPVLVANLDADGPLELATTAHAGGPLYAWKADSSLLANWPPLGDDGAAYPAASNLSGTARSLEAVAEYDTGRLYAYLAGGGVAAGWPQGQSPGARPPALADVDGDGLSEVFFGGDDGTLYAFRPGGGALAGWPVPVQAGLPLSVPAIADLDGDADLEILVASEPVSGAAQLHALHHDGVPVSGFPVAFSGLSQAIPVVGDLDGDGSAEIVLPGTGKEVQIYTAGGQWLRTLRAESALQPGSAPALADMDGDGSPEILVQTDRGVNIWHADGSPLSGWPEAWGASNARGLSSPVVGDVDGDAQPDVVITVSSTGSAVDGELRVFDRFGSLHPGFPKTLPLGAGGVPAIADIDLDGRNEIIVIGARGDGVSGFHDKVWVYDLGGGPHGPIEWGQFGGGPHHRNLYPVPPDPEPQAAALAAGPRLHLPQISKPALPPPAAIRGVLKLDGAGAGGLTVELRSFDGLSWTDLDSTVTASDGSYRFLDPRGVYKGEYFAVSYQDDGSVGTWVAEWTSRALTTYPQGASLGLGAFDLADLSLSAPADKSSVSLPVDFQWAARPGAGPGFYALVLTDPGSGKTIYQGPPVYNQTSYRLSSLPAGVRTGIAYRWAVWIHGPDGSYAVPQDSWRVTFR